jgi:hypothetical protein
VSYWTYNNGAPKYKSVALSWTSSGSGSDPLAAVPLSTVVYQDQATNPTVVLRLSDYISSWSTTQSITETANSGVHQIPGVVNITSQPVRAGDPTSSVGVQVGLLSCAAEDSR